MTRREMLSCMRGQFGATACAWLYQQRMFGARGAAAASLPGAALALPAAPPAKVRELRNGIRVVEVPESSRFRNHSLLLVGISAVKDSAGKAGSAEAAAALIPWLKVGDGTLQDYLREQGTAISSEMQYGGDSTAIRFSSDGSPAAALLATIRAIEHSSLDPSAVTSWARKTALGNKQRQRDLAWLAESAFRRHLYPDDNRRYISAPSAALDTITAADLMTCYSHSGEPRGLVVAAPRRLGIAAALRPLSPMRSSHAPADEGTPCCRFSAPVSRPQVLIADVPGSKRISLCIGNLAFDRFSADYAAGAVVGRILGYGQSSRLHNLVRSKGYAYSVFAGFSAERYLHHFSVKTEVDMAAAAPTILAILAEFDRMQHARVGSDELATAKAGIFTAFARASDTASEALPLFAEIPQYGLSPAYWSGYLRSVIRVTAEDVLSVSARYLPASNPQIIAVGDAKALGDSLQGFGPVQVITAASITSV